MHYLWSGGVGQQKAVNGSGSSLPSYKLFNGATSRKTYNVNSWSVVPRAQRKYLFLESVGVFSCHGCCPKEMNRSP